MLRALVPVAAGILSAGCIALPLWGAAAGFGLCLLAAAVSRRRVMADIYMCLALFLAGWTSAELRYDSPSLPAAGTVAEIVVDDVTSRGGGATLADGRLTAFAAGGRTVACGCRIRISAPPSLAMAAGDRMTVVCRVRPFSRSDSTGYRRYMARRGFAGQADLRPQDVVRREAGCPSLGLRLRAVAVGRIGRLGLPPEAAALAGAVTAGERSGVTQQMRRRYSLAGAAHLLAVSGLHAGLVFMIVNLLLWWLPAVRYGHLWRCAAVAAAVWFYAAVAGFTPSVTRAAAMFTVVQLSSALSVRPVTLNSLALAAFAMLLFDARTLYDAGFMLSFVAVAAIVVWGVPLGRIGSASRRGGGVSLDSEHTGGRLLPRPAGRVLRWLWRAFAAGLAASVATAPLSAWLFGTVSLWSVVTGPAAVMLGAVLLGSTLVWILLPLPVLAPAAGWVIGTAGRMLGAVVERCAAAGGVSGEVRIGGWTCAAAYLLLVSVTLWLMSGRSPWRGRRKKGGSSADC